MGSTRFVGTTAQCLTLVVACAALSACGGGVAAAALSTLPLEHRAPSAPPPLDHEGRVVLPRDWLELPTAAVLPEAGPGTLAVTPEIRFELSARGTATAIDRTTHAIRWELDDPRTNRSHLAATGCGQFFMARRHSLIAVDAETGTPAWSQTLAGEFLFELWTRGCHLIVQTASLNDGPGLFVLDATTGRQQLATRCYFDGRPTEITDEGVTFRTVEGERHFDWNRGEFFDLPFTPGTTVESISGTTVVVIEHGRRIAAIDLIDHQLRWARDLDVDPEEWNSLVVLTRVGADLVFLESDELVRRSIDDGTVRWRRPLSDEIVHGLRWGDASHIGDTLVLSLREPAVLLGLDLRDGSLEWLRRATIGGAHLQGEGDHWVWLRSRDGGERALVDVRVEAPPLRERVTRSHDVQRCVEVLATFSGRSSLSSDTPSDRRSCLSWLTRVGQDVRAELGHVLTTAEVTLAADLLVAFDGDAAAAVAVLARTYGPPSDRIALARERACRRLRTTLSEDEARRLADESASWLMWSLQPAAQGSREQWLRGRVEASVRECHAALLRTAPSDASVLAFRDRIRSLATTTADHQCIPNEDEAVAAEAIRCVTELDRDPLPIVAEGGACLSVQPLGGPLSIVESAEPRAPSIRVTRIREAGASEGATADRVVTIVEVDWDHPHGDERDVLVRRVGDTWHASLPASRVDW